MASANLWKTVINIALVLGVGTGIVLVDLVLLATFQWGGRLSIEQLQDYPGWLPAGDGRTGRFARLAVISISVFPGNMAFSLATNSLAFASTYGVFRLAGLAKPTRLKVAIAVLFILNTAVLFQLAPQFFFGDVPGREFRFPEYGIGVAWGRVVTFLSLAALAVWAVLAPIVGLILFFLRRAHNQKA